MTKIDLITGFLGAGKTTFIKKYGNYLKQKNIKFAVVENEFGASGVDSAILKSEFSYIKEISGGCICCTLKLGFYKILKELCGSFERIIVEPSGVFNGDEFFDIINSPDIADKCCAGMCITLVDPHTVDKLNNAERTVLAYELADMGCVVWTKTDVEPECDLDKAKVDIQSIMQDIGIEDEILYYPFPSHMLNDEDFEKLMNITSVKRKHVRSITDHTTIFQSTRMCPEGVYTIDDLNRCIAHMTSCKEYGEISRIKGFVKSYNGIISVNCTVSDRLFGFCKDERPMLNIIGSELNRKKISECLKSYGKVS
jgi:G3E family GTPase